MLLCTYIVSCTTVNRSVVHFLFVVNKGLITQGWHSNSNSNRKFENLNLNLNLKFENLKISRFENI
uniref:Uncharacterized protein n=1 Tax=Heterorhabditis bacteriophora TaxID=37862 RepID=A0A1I7WG38_HETBA